MGVLGMGMYQTIDALEAIEQGQLIHGSMKFQNYRDSCITSARIALSLMRR